MPDAGQSSDHNQCRTPGLTEEDKHWFLAQLTEHKAFVNRSIFVSKLGSWCGAMGIISLIIAGYILQTRINDPDVGIGDADVSPGTYFMCVSLYGLGALDVVLWLLHPSVNHVKRWQRLRIVALALSVIMITLASPWYFK